MRDFPWRYVFIAVPIIGVAAGLQYMVRNVVPESTIPEKSMALRPSSFSTSSADEVRKPAAAAEIQRERRKTRADREEDARAARAQAASSETEIYTAAAEKVAPAVAEKIAPAVAVAFSPAAAAPMRDPLAERYGLSPSETRAPANITGDVCSAVEYRGDGAEGTKITTEEWNAVARQFQAVRGELLAWLHEQRKNFADKSVEVMQQQLRAMSIQRPPQTDEPDLNWRGIAVYGHDKDGAPQLRIGSGFVKLVQKQPQRSRFELARLVAQGWSPCELQKKDGGTPWEPLLKCMGMDSNSGCGFGTYSENGWAVSSVLAQNVAPPGCAVQAFKEGNIASCVKKIPFPLGAGATASVERSVAQATATTAHSKGRP